MPRSFSTSGMPVTTVSPAILGAQATGQFVDPMIRPLQWRTPPTDERLRQPENTAAFYTLLKMLPGKEKPWTNPVIWWRNEDRLTLFTSLLKAASSSDTYFDIKDAGGKIKPGYIFYLTATNEQVLVVDVDGDYSEGWTNDASGACNVKANRTFLSGPRLAAAAGAEVRMGVPIMGELGTPKEGLNTLPGDAIYNFIQLFGLYVQMSIMQRNSLMASEYGTHAKLIADNEGYLSQFLQATLLFGRRDARVLAGEDMVYMTNGIIPQLQDNVLDVSGVGNSFLYGNMSEYIDMTRESANSSSSKVITCGEQLFMNLHNTARQEAAMVEEVHYKPELGVESFSFKTASGVRVDVYKMRFAFEGSMKDSGLVLDLANIALAEYSGFEWRWALGMDAPMEGLTRQTDVLLGSISCSILDPKTCGFIRGGVTPLLADRNGLGIVQNY